MSEKIQKTQQRLKDLGYFASEDLAKIVLLFEASGKRDKKSIPTLLLQGKSGAGKTFLAETFSQMIGADEKFVQCFPRMGSENFQYDVNIKGVMKQDADSSIKAGILLQALQQSQESPVVLVIDELDKARPEVDSFLLDFLENGRLTTGTDTYEKGQYPIYTFITSNDKREIDEALINRSKRIEVPRPSKDLFLEILGLPENHYLGWIYDKCPNFSIRQARQYIEDLEVLGTAIDEEALSQYINLDELDVTSLADVQRISAIENAGLEVELPDLERCSIPINSWNKDSWKKIFETYGKKGFNIVYRNSDLNVNIDSVEQLMSVSKYLNFQAEKQEEHHNSQYYDDDEYYDDEYEDSKKEYKYHDTYSGWFEYTITDEEIDNENIIWAGNKRESDGTRFGLKLDENRMFRIAMYKGNTYVYLDSDSANTLEAFLGQQKNIDEQAYETDSEYDEEGRDYDD